MLRQAIKVQVVKLSNENSVHKSAPQSPVGTVLNADFDEIVFVSPQMSARKRSSSFRAITTYRHELGNFNNVVPAQPLVVFECVTLPHKKSLEATLIIIQSVYQSL